MTRAKLDRTALRRALALPESKDYLEGRIGDDDLRKLVPHSARTTCNSRRDCQCDNCHALRTLTPQEPHKAPGHTRVEYAPAPDRAPYPVPSNAAHIWIAGGQLHIGLPPTGPDSRGTSVSIPLDKCGIVPNESSMAPRADQMGWQALLTTLQSRAQAPEGRHSVGTPAAPVQYDIDKVLRTMGRTSVPKAAGGGKIELTDEDLGL